MSSKVFRLTSKIEPKASIYDIEIKRGLLKDVDGLINFLKTLANRFALITDNKVAKFHAKALVEAFGLKGLNIELFSFRAGEKQKNRQTKTRIENEMLKEGYGRDSCIIAMGGGVTTDLAGFTASNYCRGIPLVVIPTSLLGMVDACIGGKTGINTKEGKNLIGALYPPVKVWIDPSILDTLPEKSLRDGFVEMIKHGLIADLSYFEFMESNFDLLLKLNTDLMTRAIYESCAIKLAIVSADEKEGGMRRLLNFGHTIGHALEKLSHYQISHGEAVAIGLVVESSLSLPPETVKRIHQLLLHYGLPFKIPKEITTEAILNSIAMDKKAVKGTPRFPALKDIGTPFEYNGQYVAEVPEDQLKKALDWMIHDLCRH